jgi:phosphoglycerate dehydrogenase-like enzyme
MATVVIAYGQRAQTELETGLLEGMGYQVRHRNGLSERSGLDDADALMVTVQEVTEAVLAAMPAGKIVARVGTGLDSIDLDEAARRGVQVTYVADYSVDEVSTHAIALLLSWARRIPQYLDLVRAGQWNSVGAGTIRRLTEQTLGVAGFGRIAGTSGTTGIITPSGVATARPTSPDVPRPASPPPASPPPSASQATALTATAKARSSRSV